MWYMVSQPAAADRSILERQDKDGDETEGASPLHVVSTRILVSENLSFQASTHAGVNWSFMIDTLFHMMVS